MEAKSIGIKSAPDGHKFIRESPQSAETTIAGGITKVPEINIEPPQVDVSSAWKMFVDETKNSLRAEA